MGIRSRTWDKAMTRGPGSISSKYQSGRLTVTPADGQPGGWRAGNTIQTGQPDATPDPVGVLSAKAVGGRAEASPTSRDAPRCSQTISVPRPTGTQLPATLADTGPSAVFRAEATISHGRPISRPCSIS
jgi:hypothetical protein